MRQKNDSAAVVKALKAVRVPKGSPNEALYLSALQAAGVAAGSGMLAQPETEEQQLLKKVADQDRAVRQTALLRLSQMQSVNGAFLPGVVKALHDPDTLNRWYAARALGNMGPAGRGGMRELIAVLDSKDDVNLRMYAATALAKVAGDDATALGALRNHLLKDGWDGSAAAQALSLTGKNGVPYLIEGLKSDEPYAIFNAAAAIARVGSAAADAVPVLLRLLDEPNKLAVAPPDSGQSSFSNVVNALKAIAPNDPRVQAALKKPRNYPVR